MRNDNGNRRYWRQKEHGVLYDVRYDINDSLERLSMLSRMHKENYTHQKSHRSKKGKDPQGREEHYQEQCNYETA